MLLEHLHIAQAIWDKSPTRKQYGSGLMKTWSGSWDVKALIWSIKYNFYFTATLPRACFTSPNCEHLQCNCLKIIASWFLFFLFFFSTPHSCNVWSVRWKRLSILPYWSLPTPSTETESLAAAGAKWDFMLLFFHEVFFPSPFPPSSQHHNISNSHVHRIEKPRRNFWDAQMAWN